MTYCIRQNKYRQWLLISMWLFAFTYPVQAVIPDNLDYQGYLTDSSGSPINSTVSVTFLLYNVSSGGVALWSDTRPVSVTNGLFTVKLGGAGNPFPLGLFDAPLWLGINVAGDGEMSPRVTISSAAFAHKADDALTLEGISASTLDQSAHAADTSNPHIVTAAQVGAIASGSFVVHAGDPDAHHIKTTSFIDLLDQAGDVQIPENITRDAELGAHASNPNTHHTPPATLPPSGAAGGDLAGIYPVPSVIDDSHNHTDATVSDSISINNGLLYAPAGAESVGIGTTAPKKSLHIKGHPGLPVPESPTVMIEAPYAPSGNQMLGLVAAGNSGDFGISRFNDGGDTLMRTDVMVEAGTGNVGIGTVTPSEQLHIWKQIQIGNPVVTWASAADNRLIKFGDGEFASIGEYGGDDDLRIKGNPIYLDGNVGIGTANPQAKLDISGTAGVDGIRFPDGTVQTSAAYTGISCAGNDTNDVMVRVGPLCMDKYEASVWNGSSGGTQYGATSDNYPCSDNGNDCSSTNRVYARSVAGVLPSRYITWFQAQQACAMSGKRLLTNAEWQMAAAGTPDPGSDNGSTDCAITSSAPLPAATGSRTLCVSNWGMNDMVGNVDEWVADWMQDNSDIDGNTYYSTPTYGSDGEWGIDEATPELDRFPAALLRGGNWKDSLPGVFTVNAYYGPSFSNLATGFRCGR